MLHFTNCVQHPCTQKQLHFSKGNASLSLSMAPPTRNNRLPAMASTMRARSPITIPSVCHPSSSSHTLSLVRPAVYRPWLTQPPFTVSPVTPDSIPAYIPPSEWNEEAGGYGRYLVGFLEAIARQDTYDAVKGTFNGAVANPPTRTENVSTLYGPTFPDRLPSVEVEDPVALSESDGDDAAAPSSPVMQLCARPNSTDPSVATGPLCANNGGHDRNTIFLVQNRDRERSGENNGRVLVPNSDDEDDTPPITTTDSQYVAGQNVFRELAMA